AGGAPGGAPFVQDGAACGGDAVVAPRRAGHRRFDVAVQQPGRAEIAQHRIQRALLAAEHAVAEAFQPLGDLVAVHRLSSRLQHRQQHQRHGATAEFLLELAQLAGDVGIGVAHGGAPVVRPHTIANFAIANVPLVMLAAVAPAEPGIGGDVGDYTGRNRHPRGPRMRPALPALLVAAVLAPSLAAADESPKPRTTQELLDASQPSDWRTLDPANTLYLELAGGRVVIELAPDFAPAHVHNIRTLAHEGYWDGMSINRSQDNFVVQWGDPAEEGQPRKSRGSAPAPLPAEFERAAAGLDFHALPGEDGWAPQVGFAAGFPAARDPEAGEAWMAHCYGAVGAGRGMAADSSDGSELYVVTGQSPRQLDRNITLVGRVVDGMELLSVLPRGTGPLGFYEDAAQRVPIEAIRLAADVPEAERPKLQVLR